MTSCKITWINNRSHKAYTNIYSEYCEKVNFLNFLQSPLYATSQATLKNHSPRIGLIDINEQPAGLVQILEIGILRNAIHAVILDRGPVWFAGQNTPENFKAFMLEYKRHLPKRLGRKMRIIPEIEDSADIRAFMTQQGYKRQAANSYQTATLDLTQTEDTLRAGLKKKWRGSLQQGEDKNIDIEWDDQGLLFPWFMEGYLTDKAAKNYDGPSAALMNALAAPAIPTRTMLIARASKNGKDLGAILIFTHGRAATYQIGWNTSAGRDNRAHHVLLWDSLKTLKHRDINTFDLGGMNDDTAANIKKFKAGLGGKMLTLPGLYT
jgi:lipid II:glycine glycyltransferase (peptidoglycan interpeptide bridge formation enzyme)